MKILLLLTSVLCVTIFAQEFPTKKVDEYFEAVQKNDKFHGSIAVSKNGKIIYENQIGWKDIQSKSPINPSTKFRIGSITKTFTAVLIMKAIEDGKLKITDTIQTFFPTIKNADKITIQNLLNHSSGIFNITKDPTYLSWMNQHQTQGDLVNRISKYASQFEPSTKAEYSNSNYILLSYILEEIHKMPYSQILENQIIQPLKLSRTSFGGTHSLENNETNSYSYNGFWMKMPETNMSIPFGAGAISSTPQEMIKFGEALFSGKIIQESSLNEMKKIQYNYGSGIFEIPIADKKFFGHDGAIDGYSSFWVIQPEDKLSIAINSNASVVQNFKLLEVLVDAFYGKDIEVPSYKVLELKSEELDQYIGMYSSQNFPLKIKIFKDSNQLFGQATGQGAFPLNAIDKHTFVFEAAGIKIQFNPENNSFNFEQQGNKFQFIKESL